MVRRYVANVSAHEPSTDTTTVPELRVPTPPAGLPTTLGALVSSGWVSRPVSEELRSNAIARLRSGEPLVPGVIGYGVGAWLAMYAHRQRHKTACWVSVARPRRGSSEPWWACWTSGSRLWPGRNWRTTPPPR